MVAVELLRAGRAGARWAVGPTERFWMFSISFSISVCWRVDVGALVDAGQERRLPVLRLGDRVAARAHDDEAGQVLVLGAEPVE